MQVVRTPEEAIDEMFSDLEWFFTFDQFGVQHGIFLGVYKGVVVCYFGTEVMRIYFKAMTAKFIFHSNLKDETENYNAFRMLVEKTSAAFDLKFNERHFAISIFGNQPIDDMYNSSFTLAQKIYDANI